jgi:hypothetical protein
MRSSRFLRPSLRTGTLLAVTVLVLGRTPRVTATTILGMDFDAQCAEAERIFVGEVKAVESRRTVANPRYIETVVTFAVEDVVAGSVPGRVDLRFFGGRVGDEQQSIDGMPEFAVGERYVVFTQADGERPLVSPVVGFNQGLYRVVETTDAQGPHRWVRDRHGQALAATSSAAASAGRARADVAAGEESREPDLPSFLAAIRAARSR